LAPSDYYLFPKLKDKIRGKQYFSRKELIDDVNDWLGSQNSDFFREGISKLVERWKLCIENKGEYFEKKKFKRKKVKK
jgi:hypothetical protein